MHKLSFRSSSGTNGLSTSRLGLSKAHSRMSSSTFRGGASSGHQKIPVVHETAIVLKRKSGAELGAGVAQAADDASFLKLVEWIRTERLASLPHKGSRWDTVLIRALFFAERLHGFETVLRRYGADSDVATGLAYGHVQLLLELGHENSAALDKAFGFFYRCSLAVASLLSRSEVLTFQSGTQEQLCLMYTDLLTLVVEVAIRFYKTVHGKVAHSASLDMYDAFGDIINVFHSRRESIVESIWKDQIESEGLGFGADFKSLSKWLAPQDRVLATLGPDHTVFADEMAEFTCVWFHDDLTKFVKSHDTVLLINGGDGSGKTTLSASIVERLQRPVARKSHSTVYCSIGAAPTQATPLHVVTTLLNQLLEIRVGNIGLYRAVSDAWSKCQITADAKAYENILWEALHEALKHPVTGGKDVVFVVDGLDEFNDSAVHSQEVLNRLAHLTQHVKGVKLVALSQNLHAPPHVKTTKYTISVDDDIRPDIHSVVIRSLARNHEFTHKSGNDQEAIVERVINASGTSFLSAVLISEILKHERTPEGFTKALSELPTPKTTIEELVLRLVTLLKPSEEAKLVLSWLVHSARPLTVDEIEHLFSIDTTTGTRSEKRVQVHHIIETVAPLLSIRENVVRPRHNLVQTAIRNLINHNKITVSVKDRPLDLLYRILTYAKLSLQEKGDPTLDNSDQTFVDKTFRRFHFLEYVIRYWTWHLRQTTIVPKGGEPKVPAELSKIFPESVNMPILEWICWDNQFPGSQEVELHELAASVRSKVFKPDHPTVLQSYINTAFYYETMENVTSASKFFYLATTVGRTVLGVSHPVVVECATRFLRLTETSVTTKRTEVVDHREQVFLLLIESYERQFGVTAEIVVETRRLLAELYIHIHEERKASDLLGITDKETTETHDHDSAEGRDLSRHLQLTLNNSRGGQALETYHHGIFDGEDDQVDTITSLDLSQVEVIIKRAETYIAQKEFLRAEEVYVELWQRLSEICRTTMASEWHAKKIDCAQHYANFLKTQKRETETASILTCLWQEYEHHELSFSETIISRLTKAAKTLKSIGYYSAALSIFQRASSYYKNVRKEHSHEFSEINEEIVITSSEALTRSLETSTKSEFASETTQKSIFQSLISDHSKKVDSTTISLSKKLTSRYIEERQYSEAITIIESTLKRTWSSFFAASLVEVTLTETFTQESIELVEQMALAYNYQRQFERVEDIYTRLFRAALTHTKNTALLEKARSHLITFYTTRGLPSKTISVYQELLAVYRRTLGPSHETTIKTLYELAALCRAHARSHPYWVEYYQQIVVALNKDSTTCDAKAIDAAIIVAESYWEERRYTDAVTLYSVLWNTFVSDHKRYHSFTEATFVQNLYERYYQCLEETKADFTSLHKVTSQYRQTTHSVFGASSTIAVEATVALARVSSMSESHHEEAIRMYEEASKSSASSSSKSISQSELRSTLTTMYKRRVTSHSHSSSSSEEISRGVSIYEGQYAESHQKYGYSSESSLTSLRELAQLYVKQSKTDVAVRELTTAVTQIITKETSSSAMYTSATSIAQTFQSINQVQRCRSLVSELHRQLIAKEVAKSTEFSFDLTKVESSSALFFLATLEYHIRTDATITLSQILSEITATYIYFKEFKRVTTTKSALDKILIAGAPLFELLQRTHRKALAQSVENEIVHIFVQRDTANLQLLSKDSPRIFIVSILDYLGKRRATDFVRAVILASNRTLSRLIAESKFREAYDVANISFIYAKYRKGYHGPHAISRGFELASYLDGRGEKRCPDEDLRKKLLTLSNTIIKEILEICSKQKINFAQVQLSELNQLIALLGEQGDYITLEKLLTDLWNTREAQRMWKAEVLLNLGRRLVCARFESGNQIPGNHVKAIRLCEDIAYNLRRVNGTRHEATLETYTLLAQLYTSYGLILQKQAGSDKTQAGLASSNFKKAVLVHEDVLRWLAHDKAGPVDLDDDEDEEDTAAAILAEHGISVNGSQAKVESNEVQDRGLWVNKHLHLLKLAYQRLGSWPPSKPYELYKRLNDELFRRFPDALKGSEGVEKWTVKGFGSGKAESNEGAFVGVTDWEILSPHLRAELEKGRPAA